MVTRQEKRDLEKDINYLFEIVKIQKHIFKDLKSSMKKVKDPRHQSYITYCIENVGKILDLDSPGELPHYDTINDFLSNLNPDELSNIRTYMPECKI